MGWMDETPLGPVDKINKQDNNPIAGTNQGDRDISVTKWDALNSNKRKCLMFIPIVESRD